jgi:hypothetical protein
LKLIQVAVPYTSWKSVKLSARHFSKHLYHYKQHNKTFSIYINLKTSKAIKIPTDLVTGGVTSPVLSIRNWLNHRLITRVTIKQRIKRNHISKSVQGKSYSAWIRETVLMHLHFRFITQSDIAQRITDYSCKAHKV